MKGLREIEDSLGARSMVMVLWYTAFDSTWELIERNNVGKNEGTNLRKFGRKRAGRSCCPTRLYRVVRVQGNRVGGNSTKVGVAMKGTHNQHRTPQQQIKTVDGSNDKLLA